MKTLTVKERDIKRGFYLVDVEGKVLGRIATVIATLLSGKHKPTYSAHIDTGDHVIVINADKVIVTGRKLKQKQYASYSGYPGGLKKHDLKTVLRKNPCFVMEHAVKGMLPKNKLGTAMLKRLRVYPGPSHPHAAQRPQVFKV